MCARNSSTEYPSNAAVRSVLLRRHLAMAEQQNTASRFLTLTIGSMVLRESLRAVPHLREQVSYPGRDGVNVFPQTAHDLSAFLVCNAPRQEFEQHCCTDPLSLGANDVPQITQFRTSPYRYFLSMRPFYTDIPNLQLQTLSQIGKGGRMPSFCRAARTQAG
jgi:hypothetical protein